jgi:hypothetical protein
MQRYGTELASGERRESYRSLSAPVETNTNFKVLGRGRTKVERDEEWSKAVYSAVAKSSTMIGSNEISV